MKKYVVISVALLACYSIFLCMFSVSKLKKDSLSFEDKWYIEITSDYINIRATPSQYALGRGQVLKGDKFLVQDIYTDDKKFVWYLIDKGWVADLRYNKYLIDYNNPNDIAPPILKYNKEIYYANSFSEITMDHLDIWDDQPGYEKFFIVYHEKNDSIDQYWIKYTVVDISGKAVSKTQKIIFNEPPSSKDVLDFSEWTQ